MMSKDILKERKQKFKLDPLAVFTERDYAEAFQINLNFEVQSEHFGNQSRIRVEGSTCAFHRSDEEYTRELNRLAQMNDVIYEQPSKTTKEFFFR